MNQGLNYLGPCAPFERSSGPRSATIAFVGEAFGEQEDIAKLPFMGSSGQELRRMCKEANIDFNSTFRTNVFNFRPPSNNLEFLCGSKLEVGGKAYQAPALKQGKYIHPQYLGEVERLKAELAQVRPNLIIALGATACWALLGSGRIGAIRGTVNTASCGTDKGTKLGIVEADWQGADVNIKCLPTYHPSAVLRNWAYRPIVIADLLKAERESKFAEIRRPQRFVLVDPTLAEIDDWTERWARNAPILSIDIETKRQQITMIGFAPSRSQALVIPFMDKSYNRFWPDLHSEVAAWRGVQTLLSLPVPKVWQNGLYDLQYILRMGLTVAATREDTMLLHHSLYPEMQKGLGFMGSIYTAEPAWKLMRRSTDSLKADDE